MNVSTTAAGRAEEVRERLLAVAKEISADAAHTVV